MRNEDRLDFPVPTSAMEIVFYSDSSWPCSDFCGVKGRQRSEIGLLRVNKQKQVAGTDSLRSSESDTEAADNAIVNSDA